MEGSEKLAQHGHSTSQLGTVQDQFERRASNIVASLNGEDVNASGYQDELDRQYGIWSLMGLALTIDNAWIALGGSIIVASCKHKLSRILCLADR